MFHISALNKIRSARNLREFSWRILESEPNLELFRRDLSTTVVINCLKVPPQEPKYQAQAFSDLL